MNIPFVIIQRYWDIILRMGIMFVDKITFLISMSRSIRFGMIEALPNRKHGMIMGGIKGILKVYRNCGFRVKTPLMNGEFAGLQGDLADQQVNLNATVPDKHAGDIERFICTVKERIRSIYTTLSFQLIPAQVVIEMANS